MKSPGPSNEARVLSPRWEGTSGLRQWRPPQLYGPCCLQPSRSSASVSRPEPVMSSRSSEGSSTDAAIHHGPLTTVPITRSASYERGCVAQQPKPPAKAEASFVNPEVRRRVRGRACG